MEKYIINKETKKLKNIDYEKVCMLKDLVTYQEGQVVSKTLSQSKNLSITLFSFDQDEEISTHKSNGDAFVLCLDGIIKITIDDKEYLLNKGELIVMSAKHPHAVYAYERCKMLLVVVL